MAKKIRIISKREGFRRCGVAHSETPIFHEPDRFAREELEQLTRDPMLVVDLVDVGEDGEAEIVASPPAQVQAAKGKAPAKS